MSTRPEPRAITNWQIAEENAADWMRAWGYPNVSLTAAGADRGVDIRADGAIAQVKFEAAQVGRPALQRLVGARGTDYELVMLFFTGAGYATPAVRYADEIGIALYQYALDGTMTAANERARQLAAGRGLPLGPTPEQLAAQRETEESEAAALQSVMWVMYSVEAKGYWSNWSRQSLQGFDRSEDLIAELYDVPLPDWWVVPPPPNWQDLNPDQEERQRELDTERRIAQQRTAREERRRNTPAG